MDLPTLISRMNPMPILVMMGGIYFLFPNFNRTFCKQTEYPDLTPHYVVSHYAVSDLVCTVGLCPNERMLGLYGNYQEFNY